MWYSNLEKTFISRYILQQHWYTCPIALPVRRNPQRRSLLTAVSATSAPGAASSATFERPWDNFWIQFWTALRYKTFPPQTGHICLRISFAMSPFTHKKKHNRMLLFGITLLKHDRHFDYWNQPLNMCVCYLDCHETGLCCYLVTHIENLLRPLQLFHFHSGPI
jgi:hypothetical protein